MRKRRRTSKQSDSPVIVQEKHDMQPFENHSLSTELYVNIETLKAAFGESSDLIVRGFTVGPAGTLHVVAVYLASLVNDNTLNNFILKNVLVEARWADLDFDRELGLDHVLEVFKEHALAVGEVKEVHDWDQLLKAVLSGDTALMVDGLDRGLSATTRGGQQRSVQEPTTQTVIRGPKDGFTESLQTNVSLIRRRLKSPKLWFQKRAIGNVSQTDVGLMYLHGIANEKVVKEVQKRLDSIKSDAILESGYIEQFIEDDPWTPFPTIYYAERPDAIVAGLLEGRVAILVDGTPFVLLVPATFTMFFQSPEDYYDRFDIANFIRILRYVAYFVSMLTPSFFVAVITYHRQMIPSPLLVHLAAQREGVPFPAFVEALLMEITFEILREAGLRMPRAVGNAISVVGALVIGEAAVTAGIVSASMVIVVAITAIASFVCPAMNMSTSARLLRFIILVLAASFGLYGVVVALWLFILHLCSLRSFGVPYLAPAAPFILKDQKDMILRVPIWQLFSRPRFISQSNSIRQGEDQAMPKPPNQKRAKNRE